jgi:signal-transduction protein with cAMP-binding, CBS, and nucleotidyltransferase domain
MHKGVTSIDGMATAKEAAAKMREQHVNDLLVEKRNPDDAWGIIVVQDLIRGVILPGRSSEEVNVYEIMTKPVITVPADMDVRKLVGMIALSSLVLENELF